ncbi:16S rRNA (guanine(527)-N(7))-methyltransferase RsmG [Sulfitobacter aestuariivivens]|uniref:Ribosomal RNA small subunit methyltransferase G n=1 Tax=Sulfitobacter aestuariivivens TaxID=2766981 RepID=A0A927D8N0_9RHOB|nr:16S rRNA (guanine(527)-N(7))-methyltransferase RsmG [Sulfitobacter aestuariivivens]MBD3665232.1 16S rRNA (guanine(527)-N(7))-methyltransferase RsmG [Sulfitobacter aestuariivivens]
MTQNALSNVSRETIDQLEAFVALIEKWNSTINLISKASLPHIWRRHIVDSAQLFELAPRTGHWVDLGSGGGLPAIVLAILSKGTGGSHQFTLVESDHRKSAFLRTSIRELDLQGRVISERIEGVAPLGADVLSARALADLTTLLGFCAHHLKPEGTALFPKGQNWKNEHAKAQDNWSYTSHAIKSETDPAAAVLKIQDIKRV